MQMNVEACRQSVADHDDIWQTTVPMGKHRNMGKESEKNWTEHLNTIIDPRTLKEI